MSMISSIQPRSAAASQQHPPRLADLLDEIVQLVQRYIALPDPAMATLIACWSANTYMFKQFKYCGYLVLRSATPQCGKSRLLQLIGLFSKGAPMPLVGATAAVIFRRQQAVLLIDEVDSLGERDKKLHGEILAILNAGFQQGAKIERMEKTVHRKTEDFQVASFDVYGPKALAGIEALADTLADRAFHIQMQRAPGKLERFNERQLEGTFQQIREGLEAWADIHHGAIETYYASLPTSIPELEGFDSRFQDISEPLVVLASLADEERPAGEPVLPRLYAALRAAAGRRQVSGRERSLIAFLEIAQQLVRRDDKGFISSEALLKACQEHPDLSYLENTQGLSGLLKNFDLRPKSNGTKRGYAITKKWLADWQSRYHPRTDGPDGVDGTLRTREGTPSLLAPSSTTSTTTPLSKKVSKLSGVSGSGDEWDLQELNSKPVKKGKGTRGTQRKQRDTTPW